MVVRFWMMRFMTGMRTSACCRESVDLMLEMNEMLWRCQGTVRCVVKLIAMVTFLIVRSVMVNRCQRMLRSVMKLFLGVERFIVVGFMMERAFMVDRFIMGKFFMGSFMKYRCQWVPRSVMKLFLLMMVMIIMEQRFHFVQGKVFIVKQMGLHRIFRQVEGL